MPKTSRLLGLVFLITFCIGFFSVFAAGRIVSLTGTSGDFFDTGVFNTGGNTGRMNFDAVPGGFSGAQTIGRGTETELYLTGIFWIQTVGWATFGESDVEMVPPPDGESSRNLWYLSGNIWSPNAGWIVLNHGESYASGVWYIPDTNEFTGFGWSPTLGWVPFDGVELTSQAGFIGQVAPEAGIGGNKTFNVLYDVGSNITTTSLARYMSVIRKNVTILMRNAQTRSINTNFLSSSPIANNGAVIYNIAENASDTFLSYSDISVSLTNDKARSLIVIGADIYIDEDVLPPPGMDTSRTIIALKNDKGQGGNIWIHGDVKKIEASLFAQGTLYSGESYSITLNGVTRLQLAQYYRSKTSLLKDIPSNQLYIRGTVGSSNTIGGGGKDGGAVCPNVNYTESTCTYDDAIKYDLNYFRIYDRSTEGRAYKDASKDDSSLIIEYDPRIVQDPPPGLEDLQ